MVEKILFLVPGFLVGFTVHEAAHALVSKWLGDRYAESQGRISLNPLRHLSPMGTLMMFLAGFGWGKPVPVNLYNYKHPKLYYLLSSLAGPASNILLCGAALAGLYGLAWFGKLETDIPENTHRYIIYYGWLVLTSILYINAILAVFNLIPIPPLDGSKIWPCLIPGMRPVWTGKATWVWFILLVVLMKGDITSKMIIDPAIKHISSLMPISYTSDKSEDGEEILPQGFPAEMEAPEEATMVSYYYTVDVNGEPNSYCADFWLDGSYPAQEFRSQLEKKMAGRGWTAAESGGQDPNLWERNRIQNEDGEVYSTLSWNKKWHHNANMFIATITYCADPKGMEPWNFFEVDYRYLILKP